MDAVQLCSPQYGLRIHIRNLKAWSFDSRITSKGQFGFHCKLRVFSPFGLKFPIYNENPFINQISGTSAIQHTQSNCMTLSVQQINHPVPDVLSLSIFFGHRLSRAFFVFLERTFEEYISLLFGLCCESRRLSWIGNYDLLCKPERVHWNTGEMRIKIKIRLIV